MPGELEDAWGQALLRTAHQEVQVAMEMGEGREAQGLGSHLSRHREVAESVDSFHTCCLSVWVWATFQKLK